MIPNSDFIYDNAFDVIEPAHQIQPFVFNSPHSGNRYLEDFLATSRLNETTIRLSEDIFVDQLFAEMPRLGAPLLRANFPRAYLDVNREPYELDPKMFDGPLPVYANTRSIRVAGGLGTIARVVAEAREIYKHRIPVAEALARIEYLYKPYHQQLRNLLAKTHVTHGSAYLIDCHSMPSNSINQSSAQRPDFVLGDRYGTSCSSALTSLIATHLSELGYHVSRNKPYAGGFITEHYGRPSTGLHALQIEINRSLYADETFFEKTECFNKVQSDLTTVFKKVFASFKPTRTKPHPLAAE